MNVQHYLPKCLKYLYVISVPGVFNGPEIIIHTHTSKNS